LRLASITPKRSNWMQSRLKIFSGNAKQLFARLVARPSAQFRLRFHPFESKIHGDSDFETPVTVFVLQVE
jgi:hypothetical protein